MHHQFHTTFTAYYDRSEKKILIQSLLFLKRLLEQDIHLFLSNRLTQLLIYMTATFQDWILKHDNSLRRKFFFFFLANAACSCTERFSQLLTARTRVEGGEEEEWDQSSFNYRRGRTRLHFTIYIYTYICRTHTASHTFYGKKIAEESLLFIFTLKKLMKIIISINHSLRLFWFICSHYTHYSTLIESMMEWR